MSRAEILVVVAIGIVAGTIALIVGPGFFFGFISGVMTMSLLATWVVGRDA